MTWWLCVRDPVEAKFLSGVFLPFTSAEAYEKSSWWLWKEICKNLDTKIKESFQKGLENTV